MGPKGPTWGEYAGSSAGFNKAASSANTPFKAVLKVSARP